ncbi:MAG: hypothetical protein Q9168_001405 [Polycauliona sp. 1 TL-2023]
MLCSNRPTNEEPLSHIYSHVPTSCFLDTILVPLCTWLYLAALVVLTITGTRLLPRHPSNLPHQKHSRDGKNIPEVETTEPVAGHPSPRRTKSYKALSVLYFLLLLAQFLMCILEIVRLSLTHLGVGLLPFTFVGLVAAGTVHLTKGLKGRIYAWRYLNPALWLALLITNAVKVAQESKEGVGARKVSKYPVADEITDVAVMIGVYAALALLEIILNVWELKRTAF